MEQGGPKAKVGCSMLDRDGYATVEGQRGSLMGSGENSTGPFPTNRQSQKSGSNRGRVDLTWDLGLGAEG